MKYYIDRTDPPAPKARDHYLGFRESAGPPGMQSTTGPDPRTSYWMFAPGTSSVLISSSAAIFYTSVLLAELDHRLLIQTTRRRETDRSLSDGIHQLDQPAQEAALGLERELYVRAVFPIPRSVVEKHSERFVHNLCGATAALTRYLRRRDTSEFRSWSGGRDTI
jgi:hypothetical protein